MDAFAGVLWFNYHDKLVVTSRLKQLMQLSASPPKRPISRSSCSSFTPPFPHSCTPSRQRARQRPSNHQHPLLAAGQIMATVLVRMAIAGMATLVFTLPLRRACYSRRLQLVPLVVRAATVVLVRVPLSTATVAVARRMAGPRQLWPGVWGYEEGVWVLVGEWGYHQHRCRCMGLNVHRLYRPVLLLFRCLTVIHNEFFSSRFFCGLSYACKNVRVGLQRHGCNLCRRITVLCARWTYNVDLGAESERHSSAAGNDGVDSDSC